MRQLETENDEADELVQTDGRTAIGRDKQTNIVKNSKGWEVVEKHDYRLPDRTEHTEIRGLLYRNKV